jgi:hypothetical protein
MQIGLRNLVTMLALKNERSIPLFIIPLYAS